MEIPVEKKFIDVEAIIKNKNPNLLRFLPRFILKYIKKIIHEKDVNDFIARHGNKYNIDFATEIIKEFGANITVEGTENIPLTEGCVFACNHPLGGADAMALVKTVGVFRTDIKFLVNDILMSLENLKGIFIPVNKHGANSTNNLMEIETLYQSQKALMIFPAGLVSRKQNNQIKDLEWKKSFITKAKKYNKNIVPVYIDGKNSNFFYNLAMWRKRIGIKANIEMFFLVDEMYKQRNKTISIIFGKPIPYQVFDKTLSDLDWAQKVKEHVYALKSKDLSKLLIK